MFVHISDVKLDYIILKFGYHMILNPTDLRLDIDFLI